MAYFHAPLGERICSFTFWDKIMGVYAFPLRSAASMRDFMVCCGSEFAFLP